MMIAPHMSARFFVGSGKPATTVKKPAGSKPGQEKTGEHEKSGKNVNGGS